MLHIVLPTFLGGSADFRGKTVNFLTKSFWRACHPVTFLLDFSTTSLDGIPLRDSKPVRWMVFLPSLELITFLLSLLPSH